MPIELPISCYRFKFRASSFLEMPSQPGVLWHSVFGKTLKERACVSPNIECEECLYLHSCDYPQLFRGVRPPQSEIMRKSNTIPPPHAFLFDKSHQAKYQQGDLLDMSLALFGASNEKFVSVATAIILAANTGLGRSRVRLKLVGIKQVLPDGKTLDLLQDGVLVDVLPASIVEHSAPPEVIKLQLLTPYQPSGNAGKSRSLALDHLLMAIIRRVDLMQYFTTGIKLQDDFRALKKITQNISILHKDVTYRAGERYSAKQGVTKQMGGFVGNLHLNLKGSETLWPFLEVGQWLNVGKNASMGNGSFLVDNLTL